MKPVGDAAVQPSPSDAFAYAPPELSYVRR